MVVFVIYPCRREKIAQFRLYTQWIKRYNYLLPALGMKNQTMLLFIVLKNGFLTVLSFFYRRTVFFWFFRFFYGRTVFFWFFRFLRVSRLFLMFFAFKNAAVKLLNQAYF
jgi:hypothetical protein